MSLVDADQQKRRLVALGTTIADRPPRTDSCATNAHGSYLGYGMFGGKACVETGWQILYWREQTAKVVEKVVPPQTAALAPTP